jgi:SAM-dependent methyltransferase
VGATFKADRREDVRSTRPWSPFAYVGVKLREMVRHLIAAADLPPGGRVLDYGCADAPYRGEFPNGVTYVGADLPGNRWADVELRSNGTVPLPEGSIDLVLSTQVLEHVEDPVTYLSESFRVLRPGGTLALSTHGVMYYHRDPEDYWRWTRAGLTKVVTESGFEVVELIGLMGLASAALQIFQDATYWKVPRLLRPVFALVMQGLIAAFDWPYSDESRVENGLVIAVRAVKPGVSGPGAPE